MIFFLKSKSNYFNTTNCSSFISSFDKAVRSVFYQFPESYTASAAKTPNESAESTIAAVAVVILFIMIFSYRINADQLEAIFSL
jgi:hypothetical protein